ncbi:MAG: anti-sigma regulatory factor [Clostridiales bacterium]|nr:anti-sigma regulatory factor [Clostridiales bacterium]
MSALIHAVYPVQAGDYTRAGEASADIKRRLKQLGVSSLVMRRVAVASYEVELNLVIHSLGGELILEVDMSGIRLTSQDVGPGIPNIEMAMQEGYSTASEEARAMGFGAGMGLPNMKRNADSFEIDSQPGKGTRISMGFSLNG